MSWSKSTDDHAVSMFDSSKNLFDSEQRLRSTIGAHCGYKEYDFEPDGSAMQQENEIKIQDLWRTIEKSGIEPYRPKRKASKSKSGNASPGRSQGKTSTINSPFSTGTKPRTWTEALQQLTNKGMDKEAECAKYKSCKLCEYSDLGAIFADEAYEDRYTKPSKPNQCN